jgi:hypothetical protein
MHYVSKGIDPPVERLALMGAAGPCMTISWDHAHGHPHEFFDIMIAAIDNLPPNDRFIGSDRLIGSPERLAAFQQFFCVFVSPCQPDGKMVAFPRALRHVLISLKGGFKRRAHRDARPRPQARYIKHRGKDEDLSRNLGQPRALCIVGRAMLADYRLDTQTFLVERPRFVLGRGEQAQR